MFETADLKVFVKVAELRSLSGAAAALRQAKSSASRQIARLEARAGVALVERMPRSVGLTDAGRVLYDRAVEVLAALQDAELAVSSTQLVARGQVRLHAPHLFATHFLAPRLPAFFLRHPEVSLAIDVSPASAGAAGVDADLCIRVGPIEDSPLIARKLGDSHLRLFGAPAAIEGRTARELREAVDRQGLLEAATLGDCRGLVRLSGRDSFRQAEIVDPTVRYAVVLAGGGIAWLPAFLCRDDVRDGRLVEVCPNEWRGPIPITALFAAHAGATPKVRALIEFVSESMDRLRGG